jgi:hypothetical protein
MILTSRASGLAVGRRLAERLRTAVRLGWRSPVRGARHEAYDRRIAALHERAGTASPSLGTGPFTSAAQIEPHGERHLDRSGHPGPAVDKLIAEKP